MDYLDINGQWRPANPKLAGSGIVACRPQVGTCLGNCEDCFFKGGRYYEDLEVPHIPDPMWVAENGFLVRMNDGNDSNYQRDLVIRVARMYDDAFFNTRLPNLDFPGPVVLTVNGDDTDDIAHLLEAPPNLMCVRVRTNSWNLDLVKHVIAHYTKQGVPVRPTFMAYYRSCVREPKNYIWKKRTLNSYWVLKPEVRARIEEELGVDGLMVHTCTTRDSHLCCDCGKCLEIYRRWKEGK